jgi:hypothetical protein
LHSQVRRPEVSSSLEARLEAFITRYSEWFGRRIQKCEERITKHTSDIRNFMLQHEVQKLATPEGTAYFRDTTSFVWPDDENLIAFLKANKPELVETREVVNKNNAKKYIHETGNVPPGYEEKTEPRLYIKDPQ